MLNAVRLSSKTAIANRAWEWTNFLVYILNVGFKVASPFESCRATWTSKTSCQPWSFRKRTWLWLFFLFWWPKNCFPEIMGPGRAQVTPLFLKCPREGCRTVTISPSCEREIWETRGFRRGMECIWGFVVQSGGSSCVLWSVCIWYAGKWGNANGKLSWVRRPRYPLLIPSKSSATFRFEHCKSLFLLTTGNLQLKRCGDEDSICKHRYVFNI